MPPLPYQPDCRFFRIIARAYACGQEKSALASPEKAGEANAKVYVCCVVSGTGATGWGGV